MKKKDANRKEKRKKKAKHIKILNIWKEQTLKIQFINIHEKGKRQTKLIKTTEQSHIPTIKCSNPTLPFTLSINNCCNVSASSHATKHISYY